MQKPKIDPEFTTLPANHVEIRSHVRFKMAAESAALAKEYRASGLAQALADTEFEHVISFPSKDETL